MQFSAQFVLKMAVLLVSTDIRSAFALPRKAMGESSRDLAVDTCGEADDVFCTCTLHPTLRTP